jgi:membrane protein implicated in regulation of membrane protease activity
MIARGIGRPAHNPRSTRRGTFLAPAVSQLQVWELQDRQGGRGVSAVFLVIGAVGLGVLLLSLFAGELGELGFGHVDADGWFSIPALAAVLGGIGFGGAAAVSLLPQALPDAATALLALAVGLLVAVPLGWGAVRLSRALRDMPTQETLTRHHLAGTQGVVVSAVPVHGYGEVRLTIAGQQLKFFARSDADLPAGTPVYVVEALSETAVHVVSTAPERPFQPLPEPEGDPS